METCALNVVVVCYECWMHQLHYPTFKMNNLQWAFCTGFEGSRLILETRPRNGSEAAVWGWECIFSVSLLMQVLAVNVLAARKSPQGTPLKLEIQSELYLYASLRGQNKF